MADLTFRCPFCDAQVAYEPGCIIEPARAEHPRPACRAYDRDPDGYLELALPRVARLEFAPIVVFYDAGALKPRRSWLD